LFDAILLDAPCSASGIVRRHPDIRWLRRPTDIGQLVATQARLLNRLWPLLRPGGRLLYCTCSVFRAEGEQQIAAFLARNTDAALTASPGHLTIGCMTMMAFTTHCLKNAPPSWLAWLLAALLSGFLGVAAAQLTVPELPRLKLERTDDGLWLSTQLEFELPDVVEEALHKGIPIFFVAQADLLRKRWYWTDKKLAQRWRLNITLGESAGVAQGLVFNQNFESLVDAMAAVRRIFRWKIADVDDLEAGGKLLVDFQFQLDVAQLPRPLRIGTLGQSDWSVVRAVTQALEPEPAP